MEKQTVNASQESIWTRIFHSNWFIYILISPLFLVLFAYVVYPFYQTFTQSFAGDEPFLHYKKFFNLASPANLEALWTSIYISIISVLCCAIVGVTMAFLLERYNFPGRRILSILVLVPMALPPLVGVLSFSFLYGDSGIFPRIFQHLFGLDHVPFSLKGIWGVIVVHTFTMYTYFYLTASAAIKGLDPALEEAATSLGAGRIRVWTKVILPMLTPSIVASSLLVFMISMASYTAPLMFGVERTMTMQIYLSRTNGNLEMAATQSMILSFVSITFLVMMRWYQNRRNYQNLSKGISVHRSEVSSKKIKIAATIASFIGTLILILPILVLILISFSVDGAWKTQILPTDYTLDHYMALFTDERTWRPIWNSIQMGIVATFGNIIFGVAAAYAMVRLNFKGKTLLDILIMVPWALPGTVVAVNLIAAFSTENIFAFNQVLIGTFWILPLAYFIRHLPLVFRSTSASLVQLDPSIEEASRGLGANWWYTFRRIVVPLTFTGILAGTLLALVQSFGEFVASILIYSTSTIPLSVAIFQKLYAFKFGTACAYGVLQICLILVVLIISEKLSKGSAGTAI
ncbi:iron ABC transporter permease [Lysinibacillus fusiformis]|jgi:iron(III) transport system permease protein|uniref:ABC transporter permease n=1 Tax=Lysinibacillus TaxID=400634 RepID=UPI0004D42721|nr:MULTISPECIES: iron ABC transporter permease [Lysinibacillus]AJK89823.1 iron ABC transporter permease [Lysinibacillus fusiformis]KAB0441005.1 iron ABC transporter permease [Lysinibacillus fusiformis]KHK51740.1 iron ABC transporter permease [Lysinibacillus sp. A1]MCE4046592.1 iron ABC transporter permease [Lysinibacillus fusiformis]MCT6817734.1 iron ABC transporter permease [Lysinibacillus fusiformis]